MDHTGTSTTTRSERTARRGRAEQERLLAAFEVSGLSQTDFARKHGLTLGTFRGWLYKRARKNPQPLFAPVRITRQPGETASTVTIRLCSGLEVFVPLIVGMPAVADLVKQLEKRC